MYESKNDEDEQCYVCVNCATPSTSLYQQYGEDVIRLTQCKKCGNLVDKYIEYDNVLVIIDIILQYIGAYRHLLVNTKCEQYYRIGVIFVMCDAYYKWIERRSKCGFEKIYDLEWKFYECLVQSIVELFLYIAVVAVFASQTERICRFRRIIEASVAGSYGNVFIVLSIVWQLHTTFSYRALTEFFNLISHIQVQRTIFSSYPVARNIATVVAASVFSRLGGFLLNHLLF
ncbi:hypothetical protein AB6A40_000223 [Gnathostoma spinigerum]|uniref:Protein ARV n=1 Tax=Gnathostoma spinigerum TaxID=75299 RepID=A0ABD6E1N4_9BILA